MERVLRSCYCSAVPDKGLESCMQIQTQFFTFPTLLTTCRFSKHLTCARNV